MNDYRPPILPASRYRATLGSGFEDPKRKARHVGQDSKVGTGEPVHAIGEGRVVTCSQHRLYGFYIEVQHPNGDLSTYNQLQYGRRPGRGDWVRQGQVVGYVGHPLNGSASRQSNPIWSGCAEFDAFGNRISTGPHLHNGIKTRRSGWVDPLARINMSNPAGGSGTPIPTPNPAPSPAPEPPKEWDEMASKQEVQDAVSEALQKALDARRLTAAQIAAAVWANIFPTWVGGTESTDPARGASTAGKIMRLIIRRLTGSTAEAAAIAAGYEPGVRLVRFAKSSATGDVWALYDGQARFRFRVIDAETLALLGDVPEVDRDAVILPYTAEIGWDAGASAPTALLGWARSSDTGNTFRLAANEFGQRFRTLVTEEDLVAAGVDLADLEPMPSASPGLWDYTPTNQDS